MKTVLFTTAVLFGMLTAVSASAETTVIKKHEGMGHSKKVIIKHHGGMTHKKVVIKKHED